MRIDESDFICTRDKSREFIIQTMKLALVLRKKYTSGNLPHIFQSGLAVSIFKDKSTRTRYSFASAASILGLGLFDFDETTSQISHGETVMETANMLGFTTRAIGIRDDIYIGIGDTYMRRVAAALQWGFDQGTLLSRPSVINLQSDVDHPTQSLSDLCHLVQLFHGVQNLKGKKITVSWAYSPSYGKPLSVPQGTIALLSRFGMDITLAYPKGYHLTRDVEEYAAKESRASGGRFRIMGDMKEAMSSADIIYPKSWASYDVMEKRTEFLKMGGSRALENLEAYALRQNAHHKKWTCTPELLKLTNRGKALYMHCLPADISGVSCDRGEVSADVFERYKPMLYAQAGYKPFIIASMILMGQYHGDSGAIQKRLRTKAL